MGCVVLVLVRRGSQYDGTLGYRSRMLVPFPFFFLLFAVHVDVKLTSCMQADIKLSLLPRGSTTPSDSSSIRSSSFHTTPGESRTLVTTPLLDI